ncbi:DUF4870 domain-containing protein [Endozoicomonas sp. OPT23]|uniref:DUF4870 domain-containing protein n=1 Tax=Endozoicomonas sp. OPT23 TaxID=2072845 RepID=UPI00129BEF8B|nr:DUF4870 domain-containing protein [Endozoicomonas sp. OPT23]MRI35451.1 DUF4870 domain-containing protein [Endozoicomonas sp. OPT23]
MEKDPLYELMRTPEPDEKNLAMLAHLLSFTGFLIPGMNIVAPLLIWLNKRDSSPFVAMHARESLNFQISVAIFVAIWVMLKVMLVGFLLLPLVPFAIIALLIIVIRAGLKASSGEEYRYPLCFRFVN